MKKALKILMVGCVTLCGFSSQGGSVKSATRPLVQTGIDGRLSLREMKDLIELQCSTISNKTTYQLHVNIAAKSGDDWHQKGTSEPSQMVWVGNFNTSKTPTYEDFKSALNCVKTKKDNAVFYLNQEILTSLKDIAKNKLKKYRGKQAISTRAKVEKRLQNLINMVAHNPGTDINATLKEVIQFPRECRNHGCVREGGCD